MLAVRSWKALGTSVHVVTTDEAQQDAAELTIRETLADVDATYSRFRPDSELSKLNRSQGKARQVSALLARAIQVALQSARVTNGAVDPTIGAALRVAGYDDDFARLTQDRGPITLKAVTVPGWQVIGFNALSRTVLLPRGVELDLGSTGKALAADLAANAARLATTGDGVLVSLGGDIATAGTAPAGGWRILVAEDSNLPPDSDGQVVCIPGGGIATSSTTVRKWRRGEQSLHHIIDPQTGRPTEGPWRTVTVLARTCVEANTAATAALVQGESAIDWLEAHGYAARLVERDGTVHFVGRWPAPKEVGHE
jgi:thiamine biosynthesis lipoprotein